CRAASIGCPILFACYGAVRGLLSFPTRRSSDLVLLVDDEGAVANAHATWLTRQGFDAVPVLSAEEALALASQEDFDAVVTDINMPEMSGVELLRALREYDRDVPVILLTGAPAIESAAEAVNYGALQYLMKPVPPDQLTSSVRRAVQLNRLAAAKRLALQELGPHTGAGGRP